MGKYISVLRVLVLSSSFNFFFAFQLLAMAQKQRIGIL
jgi:hypothetical protein